MKLFCENGVHYGVLTYFKDVFLAGPSCESLAFFSSSLWHNSDNEVGIARARREVAVMNNP